MRLALKRLETKNNYFAVKALGIALAVSVYIRMNESSGVDVDDIFHVIEQYHHIFSLPK